MAKTSGIGDNYFVDGYNLSGDTNSLGTISGGPAPIVQTSIVQGGQARAGGLRTGDIQWVSYFNDDTVADSPHTALKGLSVDDRICSYLRGTAIGNAMASCVAKQIGYDPTRGADGALTIAVAATSDEFGIEWGQQLTAGIRTDTTATNGASLDGGASSSFGLQAYLHVFSVTGTSVTVSLEDSANNSTWAAISGASFAAATGKGAQRISISNAATVRRYVRAVTTGTFTNAQFAVNLVRNEVAGVVF